MTSLPDLAMTPTLFQILLALADRERHGYAVMQEIGRSTAGQIRIGPGTLYRALKQLLKAGWIEESDERPDPALDDERRRYYRLSALGYRAAEQEAARLLRLTALAAAKLGGAANPALSVGGGTA